MKNFYFFLYGFSSIFFQTYFLRETIFLGGGNELTFGFFFFFWFLGIFFGALYGKYYKGSDKSFIFFFSFFPFFSFLNYIFVYFINYLFPISLGSEPVFLRALFSSFGLSFFVGFFIGFLFPQSILFQKDLPKLFLFESLGSFASGIFLTLFLLKFLSPYKGILLLSFIIFLFSIKKLKYFAVLPLFLLIFENEFNYIRYKSIGILGDVEKEAQSPYQNIIITSLKDVKCIYLNGRFSSQFPSVGEINIRYYPFFLIPKNLNDLLIYGFPMGNERQLENLKIKNIKIVEPDPFLIKQFKAEEKFYVKKDIRAFLKEKKEKYDLIIMDIQPPNSLLSSRLLTVEFFKNIKNSLKDDGYFLLYLNLPSDYWGKEMEEYSSSIYNSLKSVFAYVKLGISQDPFFISSFKNFDVEKAIEERKKLFEGIDGFSPSILKYFFNKEKVKYLEDKLNKEKVLKNYDHKPFYFLQILKIKSKIEEDLFFYKILSLPKYLIFFLFVFPLIYLKENLKIYFPVFSNGFAGIGIYLILSFSFQVKNGIFYSYIGLLTSLFMLGLAISAPLAKYLFKKNVKIFLLEIIFIIYLISLLFLNSFPTFLFYIFFLLGGCLSGLPFTFIGLLKGGDKKGAANVDANDHLGASIGAITVGTILTPLFGIYFTLLIFISIKIYSIILNIKK